MSSFTNLFLFLAVCICAMQITSARVNKRLLDDVNFALRKTALKVEHELDLEKIDFQHRLKIELEDKKRKMKSKESLDCIKKNWLLAEETVIAISNKGKDCINNVNGEIDSVLIKKENLDGIDDFKTSYKAKLQECKTGAVKKISSVVKQLYAKDKSCSEKTA